MRTLHRVFLPFTLICCIVLLSEPTLAERYQTDNEPSNPIHTDALIPPPPPAELASSSGERRGLSQFMAGHVAARLVLPESNGVAEPSTEDWSQEQIAAITQQVQAGLDWWATQLPRANLRFSLETQLAPTAYEPVNHGLRDETLWISDSLAQLGYRNGSHFDRAYAAGHDLRRRQGSDWALTIFIVNSARDPDGRFNDSRFAYAYIGGPFMVLTSDVGPYGANQLAPVVAHELGHIFGALDQYKTAQVPCDERSGYLNEPTSNSQVGGCPTNLPSIMREIQPSYTNGAIDPSARVQVGYRDSDNDGIIDPLDTTPSLQLQPSASLQTGERPRFSGRSADPGHPSPSQSAVSLNHIVSVEYRANGGPWQHASASDGAFDSADEGFFSEAPLYDGAYTLEFRTTNSIGASSVITGPTITVSGIGPQPDYQVNVPQQSRTRSISVTLSAPTTTSGVQISTDPLLKDTAWRPYTNTMTYELPSADDGAHTIYVRFRDAAGLVSLVYPQQILLDTKPPSGQIRVQPGTPPSALLDAVDQGTGVTAMQFKISGSEMTWQAYQHNVALPPDANNVRVRFRDGVGNESSYLSAGTTGMVYIPLVSASR